MNFNAGDRVRVIRSVYRQELVPVGEKGTVVAIIRGPFGVVLAKVEMDTTRRTLTMRLTQLEKIRPPKVREHRMTSRFHWDARRAG